MNPNEPNNIIDKPALQNIWFCFVSSLSAKEAICLLSFTLQSYYKLAEVRSQAFYPSNIKWPSG